MKNRLIELIKQAKKHTREANSDIERNMIFADYLLANGVILPPCKVGDIVYLTDGIRVYEDNVREIRQYKHKTIYVCWSVDFDETAIGTSIFLTKEEAERVLAERNSK